jgi:uncharacterized protein YkwD
MHVRAHRRASRIGITAIVLAGAALASGQAASARSARTACPGAFAPALTITATRAEHSTLCLVNQIRRRHGLRALRPMRSLRVAAAGFAAEMVGRGFFAHVGPDGDLVARLRRTGFIRRDVSWTVGENLAWGVGASARPASIVDAWMHSGPHRHNLLTRGFRRIGIGVDVGVPAASAAAAAKAHGGATYVADFGTRSRP